MMKNLVLSVAVLVVVAFQNGNGADWNGGLPSEKNGMAQVFANAWRTDENSVGIYSMPGFEDTDFWTENNSFSELDKQGYQPLLLRESLKGNPPKVMYFQTVLVMDGKEPDRPFVMVPGARAVFVLRRLPSGRQGKDDLVFLVQTSETAREYFMAEEGYDGFGCLEWPEKTKFGLVAPNAPAYFVHLSTAELEDFKRCEEWVSGDATKIAETPWGQTLKQIVTKQKNQ